MIGRAGEGCAIGEADEGCAIGRAASSSGWGGRGMISGLMKAVISCVQSGSQAQSHKRWRCVECRFDCTRLCARHMQICLGGLQCRPPSPLPPYSPSPLATALFPFPSCVQPYSPSPPAYSS